jgi:two-component system, cell cycle sensor histidine kinase and response regulator CckA
MVMPGLDGRALAEKLTLIRADMKVVYMSGYTAFSHSAPVDSDLVFLPKPFTKQSLLTKLRQILTPHAELTKS